MGLMDWVRTAVANGKANQAAREQRYNKYALSTAKAGRAPKSRVTWGTMDAKRQKANKQKQYWRDKATKAQAGGAAGMKKLRREIAVRDFFSDMARPKRRRRGLSRRRW